MKRFINPDIALGFAVGIIAFLFISVVLSYQIENCGQIERRAETSPTAQPQQPIFLQSGEDRHGTKAEYDKSHPIACGFVDWPAAAIGYMDEHEGFFVGFFTFALVVATIALWRSTQGLWRASHNEFIATHRPRITLRRIVGIAMRPDGPGEVTVKTANIGVGTARIFETAFDIFIFDGRDGELDAPRLKDEIVLDSGRYRDFPVIGKKAISQQEINFISSGKATLCLRGLIRYSDTAGTVRITSIFRIFDWKTSKFIRSPEIHQLAEMEYED